MGQCLITARKPVLARAVGGGNLVVNYLCGTLSALLSCQPEKSPRRNGPRLAFLTC